MRPFLVLLGLRPRSKTHERPLDDRNHWWAEHFDNYSMLPRKLDSLCELGCGPYTNTRLLLRGRSIRTVCCADPLVPRYVSYERAWLGRNWRERRLAVTCHAAEDCPYAENSFAVTVLINVLDHVFDPGRCIGESIRITRPGGWVVFGQDLTEHGDQMPGNPGHPITLSLAQIQPCFNALETIYSRIVPKEKMHEPAMHSGAWAFVGRKPLAASHGSQHSST